MKNKIVRGVITIDLEYFNKFTFKEKKKYLKFEVEALLKDLIENLEKNGVL